MRLALRLAQNALGETAPNPMVGAVLVRDGVEIGRGWHHRAGAPHAEIEALQNAKQRGQSPEGATLYVTLEPCSTHGRTPPCTEAIIQSRIQRVVAAATDPNPNHAGRGFDELRSAGIEVTAGLLADAATALNPGFNHWIRNRTPWVTLKVGMTLDGKIATATGESKWITGEASRRKVMRMRRASDAILVGIGTVLADNPSLTVRVPRHQSIGRRRIILDTHARTPVTAQVVADAFAGQTSIIVGDRADSGRVSELVQRVRIIRAPLRNGRIDLPWLMGHLGAEGITTMLVEGGGEVHAAFIEEHLAHEIAFFYAPQILGGTESVRAVGGSGAISKLTATRLKDVRTAKSGDDLFLKAIIASGCKTDETTPRSPVGATVIA